MCSRYSLTSPPEAVRQFFAYHDSGPLGQFPPRYNIAPTQPIGIVRTARDGEREFTVVRWGLIPSWVKDARTVSTMINARSESAAEKPSFRGAMRHRRCIVPADAFFEWTGPAGRKQPHLIRLRGRELMGFAGIFEHWLGADGSEIESAAILTGSANREMSAIHERMPVILAPEEFDAWLDCRSGSSLVAEQLLRPLPDGLLEIARVSPRLNDYRNDGPELHEPIAEDEPKRLL